MLNNNYEKYAVIGTHGSGKSTFALRLAYHLKKNNKNVDTVQERVRYSPFPFNKQANINTAMWAYHSQICRELEAVSRGFDTIICDRAAIDCIIYAKNLYITSPCFERIVEAAYEWMYSYDKIFFLRPDIPLVVDSVRSNDSAFRDGVDFLFKGFMDTWRVRDPKRTPQIYELKSSEIMEEEFKDEWIA